MQMLLAFVLGVCAGPAMSVVVPVTMGNHWDGGFEGKFCIPFSVDVTSWKAHIQFSEPVTKLEIWLAEIESQTPDGREFVLVNKPFNGDEHVGDSLCINFNGHGNGDINPTVNLTVDLPLPTTTQTTTTTTASPTTPTTTRTLAPGETWPPTTEPITPLHKRHNITSQMKLSQHYGTTWEGEFCFDLKVEIVAWELDIHFSQETKSLNNYDGVFISDTTSCTKHAVLVNKNTKGVHYGGSNYCVRMTGQVCGGGVPSAYAVLVDVTNDDQTVPRVPLVEGAQATKYNYGEILMKSILFYEAQRSGKLPLITGSPGGGTRPGDNVKFNFPMAFSTTLLTWSLIRYKDAYNATGQLEDMYKCIKWPLDYFIKCHTKPNELWVQVGNGGTDHGSWTSPERMTMSRPAYKIDTSAAGSDIAMETASAMAAGSIAFKDKDPAYSAILLKHAKELFDFGKNNQEFYSASVSAAAGFYTSQNFTDENSWGGMWLYKATGDKAYLDYAELHHIGVAAWGFSWDEKVAGANMLLYEETKKDLYKKDIEDTFTMWFPGGDVPYSPKCMAFRLQWGALRYAANTAFIALVAADNGLHTVKYRKWAMSQLHYAYGDTGRSYIVGFGVNPPVKPHHRASSCPMLPAPCGWDAQLNKGPNPHTLYGAMVGGPGQSDDYTDSRMDYVKNEVACDYNAGMHASTAALEHLALTHELPTTYKDICP